MVAENATWKQNEEKQGVGIVEYAELDDVWNMMKYCNYQAVHTFQATTEQEFVTDLFWKTTSILMPLKKILFPKNPVHMKKQLSLSTHALKNKRLMHIQKHGIRQI